MVWEVLGKERAKAITIYTKLKLYYSHMIYMLRKFWKLFIFFFFFFFFFFSSSKLQHEQHNAWTWGLHHSKAYLPEMISGSLKGCA